VQVAVDAESVSLIVPQSSFSTDTQSAITGLTRSESSHCNEDEALKRGNLLPSHGCSRVSRDRKD
jgi:hypothetical protein